MKKNLIILGAFVFLLSGCGTEQKPKEVKISLTEQEMKDSENNSNIAAQILVKKAVLKEMENVKYSEEEKKELEEIKENIELEYFLNKKAMETANVDDMEVLQVYQNNIDKLKDADITAVLPQLKDQMLFQRREEEKVKYMNSLVEKYKLNDELKKYFPESENKEETAEEVKPAEESKAEETKNKNINKFRNRTVANL